MSQISYQVATSCFHYSVTADAPALSYYNSSTYFVCPVVWWNKCHDQWQLTPPILVATLQSPQIYPLCVCPLWDVNLHVQIFVCLSFFSLQVTLQTLDLASISDVDTTLVFPQYFRIPFPTLHFLYIDINIIWR